MGEIVPERAVGSRPGILAIALTTMPQRSDEEEQRF